MATLLPAAMACRRSTRSCSRASRAMRRAPAVRARSSSTATASFRLWQAHQVQGAALGSPFLFSGSLERFEDSDLAVLQGEGLAEHDRAARKGAGDGKGDDVPLALPLPVLDAIARLVVGLDACDP